MPKRLRFVGCATVALVASAVSTVHAQARVVTVDYENAHISKVAQSFSAFSGRSISVAPDVGDPTLTGSARGLAWDAALDQLLASTSLIARPDSGGGLRIERERKVTIEFENAPLVQVLRSIAEYSGYRIEYGGIVGESTVTATVRNTDWQRALDQVLAPLALVARPDSLGIFRIEPRQR